MLTNDFNLLDLTFIKVWSQFQIDKNLDLLLPKLQMLALQGQPNAIAKWYEFNDVGVCPELDNQINNCDNTDFEFLLAKGWFLRQSGANTLNEKVKIYTVVFNTARHYARFEYRPYSLKEFRVREREYVKDIKENTYISYFRKACKQAFHKLSLTNDSTNKIPLLTRANEIMVEYANQLPQVLGLKKERTEKLKYTMRFMEKHLKDFAAKYLKLKKSSFGANQYPIFYFSFANYISTLNKLSGKENKKFSDLAQTFYEDLSKINIPFSERYSEEIEP